MEIINWEQVFQLARKEQKEPYKTTSRIENGREVIEKHYNHPGSEGYRLTGVEMKLPFGISKDIEHYYVVFGDCPSGATKFISKSVAVLEYMSCNEMASNLTKFFLACGIPVGVVGVLGLVGNPTEDYFATQLLYSSGMLIGLGFFGGNFLEGVCKYVNPSMASRVEVFEELNLCLVPPIQSQDCHFDFKCSDQPID